MPIINSLPDLNTLNEYLEYDSTSESGLRWKVDRRGTAKAGTVAGTVNYYGYWQTRVNGTKYYNSRLIAYMKSRTDRVDMVVDHIDGNTRNNNVENLQYITHSQNLRKSKGEVINPLVTTCLLYTSPSPRDGLLSRMPSSA